MLHKKMFSGIYIFLNQLWSWKRIRHKSDLVLPPQNLLLIRTVFDLSILGNCGENPKTNLSNHRLKKSPKTTQNPFKHIYQSPCLSKSRFAFVLVFLQNCPKIQKLSLVNEFKNFQLQKSSWKTLQRILKDKKNILTSLSLCYKKAPKENTGHLVKAFVLI